MMCYTELLSHVLVQIHIGMTNVQLKQDASPVYRASCSCVALSVKFSQLQRVAREGPSLYCYKQLVNKI
jgi:hypothetical protein